MARNGHPREQIGARLRFEVLRRCNFACYYCGVPASMGLKVLHVDHVIPVTLGGKNVPWNLVAACWDCNLGKSAAPPTPELVARVRREYAASEEARGTHTINCQHCLLPIEIPEGEDDRERCETCDTLLFDGLDHGILSAFNHPERSYLMYLRLTRKGANA